MSPDSETVSTSTRIVLAVGIVVGLSSIPFVPVLTPEQFMLASDVYRYAAEAMLAGEGFYAVSPPRLPGYTFIYPPVVVFVFVPHAVVGTAAGAFAIQTVLNLLFAAGTTLVICRALDRRGVSVSRLDWALIAGFVLVSAHSAITLINGQVTLWLGFALSVGLFYLQTNRQVGAGVAFGLAALVKVFPAVVGLWLVRRQAWQAVGAAILTGLGGLALGAVALGPETTAVFFGDVLLDRHGESTFAGRPAPEQSIGGLQRQIAALTGLGSPLLPALAVLIVGPLVLSLYRRDDTDLHRQSAVLGTIIGMLLVLPLQRLYMPLFVFPLLLVLCTIPQGRARDLLIVGLLFSYARVSYDVAVSAVESAPLLSGFEHLLVDLLAVGYQFILPSTLGLWLMLGACLLVHARDQPSGGTH